MDNDPDEYVLFIDETGTASPEDTDSPYYILSGCAVKESDRQKLKMWADHIKFKYWGRTDVVFHSKDMSPKAIKRSRDDDDFAVLKSEKTYDNFLTDLEALLAKHEFYMLYVLVDKKKARARRWNDIKIYKETSDSIIKNFLCFLMIQKARGKIVIESATTEKDFYFHKTLGNYLGNGLESMGITHKQVKETLTSISFVTKNNHDIEEQIADLLAYAGKFRYHGAKPGTYETMLLKILKKKMATEARIEKMNNILKPRYVKHLNYFEVLPAAEPKPKEQKPREQNPKPREQNPRPKDQKATTKQETK